ncbi:MAG: hypothetical protein HRT61_00370 [Ekhidna sp.]|jgi:hypothetical protein|nr:hypothetical protein [Ekhidna sp.]
MANITTEIRINSSDLTTDTISLSATSTLTKAGTTTGLSETSGIGRRTTTATSQVTLFAAADYTDDKAHKIYLKNTSSTATEYYLLTIGTQAVGRIYAGDAVMIPWDGTADFKFTPSVSTSMTLEFALFYEA